MTQSVHVWLRHLVKALSHFVHDSTTISCITQSPRASTQPPCPCLSHLVQSLIDLTTNFSPGSRHRGSLRTAPPRSSSFPIIIRPVADDTLSETDTLDTDTHTSVCKVCFTLVWLHNTFRSRQPLLCQCQLLPSSHSDPRQSPVILDVRQTHLMYTGDQCVPITVTYSIQRFHSYLSRQSRHLDTSYTTILVLDPRHRTTHRRLRSAITATTSTQKVSLGLHFELWSWHLNSDFNPVSLRAAMYHVSPSWSRSLSLYEPPRITSLRHGPGLSLSFYKPSCITSLRHGPGLSLPSTRCRVSRPSVMVPVSLSLRATMYHVSPPWSRSLLSVMYYFFTTMFTRYHHGPSQRFHRHVVTISSWLFSLLSLYRCSFQVLWTFDDWERNVELYYNIIIYSLTYISLPSTSTLLSLISTYYLGVSSPVVYTVTWDSLFSVILGCLCPCSVSLSPFILILTQDM